MPRFASNLGRRNSVYSLIQELEEKNILGDILHSKKKKLKKKNYKNLRISKIMYVYLEYRKIL